MASLQSVNVDGVELSFVERGSGRSVIFIHGIPTDYRAWDAQVEALSKDFHALSYSRRCAYPNKREDFSNRNRQKKDQQNSPH
jgi:pimeloyl-ACP methyl ester carboxylesterase